LILERMNQESPFKQLLRQFAHYLGNDPRQLALQRDSNPQSELSSPASFEQSFVTRPTNNLSALNGEL
jgi:hypothetical protein